jgi:hypothetical protein
MANLSSRTGLTPVQTTIALANNTTTTIQNFGAYDAQELIGYVSVDADTDYRAAVRVTVVKNGAGTYEVAASDVAGDDLGGNPIVTFSMSGSNLQATLPEFTPGFVGASIKYHLVAPVTNGNYPLSIDGGQILSGTVAAARLPEAGASDAGIITTGAQTIAGRKTIVDGITLPSGITNFVNTTGAHTGGNNHFTLSTVGPASLGSSSFNLLTINTFWTGGGSNDIFTAHIKMSSIGAGGHRTSEGYASRYGGGGGSAAAAVTSSSTNGGTPPGAVTLSWSGNTLVATSTRTGTSDIFYITIGIRTSVGNWTGFNYTIAP